MSKAVSFLPYDSATISVELSGGTAIPLGDAYSCVARLGEPFLSPFAAALVGGASETSIACYSSSIPQFPREDLVHQHVRRFYTNTNNAGDQSDHRVWCITGRLLHTLQARLLDLADLITDEPPALEVAMQLS